MDALRVAAPLSRLLLALGEAGYEGELSVVQRDIPCTPVGARGPHSARLSIARGRVLALSGIDMPPLGDTLLALGALDVASQRSLLTRGPAESDGQRVGARLVAAGATSSGAVTRALELQLAHGVDMLLRWPAGKTTLSAPVAASRSASCFVTLDLVSTVWSALLALALALPDSALLRLAGGGALVLSSAGQRRVRGLLFAADSGALAQSFGRRAIMAKREQVFALDAELLRAALRCPNTQDHASLARPRARSDMALRAVLRVLGAAAPQPAPEDSYALLLRKTRELARNASANVLLDLPAEAGAAHARVALRRLASKLHPDRFQAGDARLYAVSHRVMGALARAEHTLRAAPTT
jgi:hypothetical protein